MKRDSLILVGVVLLLATSAAAGVAVDREPVQDSITLETNSGVAVSTSAHGGEIELTTPFVDDQTVAVNTANGNATVSGANAASLTIDSFSSPIILTNIDATGTTVTVTPDGLQPVGVGGGVETARYYGTVADDNSVDRRYTGGTGTTTTATFTGLTSGQTYLARDLNSGDSLAVAEADGSGDLTFSGLPDGDHRGAIESYQTTAPTIDASTARPDPTQTISGLPVTLGVEVDDADFGNLNEELSVEWSVDGQQVATTTATQPGEVTYQADSLTAGEHTWSIDVTDAQGNTVSSQSFALNTPGELIVYDEVNPAETIDNATLRIRFFDGDSREVVQRTVTDGTVNMTGLPAGQQLVVTVDDEGDQWVYRRIVLSSLTQQADVYLLPVNATSSQVNFGLDDATGNFPSESTQLFIERAITKDFDGDGETETEYRVISGDNFGAAQDFPTVLETNERYRLRVRNGDGDVRVLGSYTASGDAAEVLEIGTVSISSEADAGAAATARVIGEGDQRSVRVIYDDVENQTDALSITIHEQGNESAVLATDNVTGVSSYVGTYQIPASAPEDIAYEIGVEADRGDSTFSTTEFVGDLPELVQRFNLDPAIAGLIGWVGIVAIGGLVVIYNARLGALTMVVVAGFTTVIGATQIPATVLALGGSVAIVFLVAGRDATPV